MSQQLRDVLTMALVAIDMANYYAAEQYLCRCISITNRDKVKFKQAKTLVFRALVAVRRKM